MEERYSQNIPLAVRCPEISDTAWRAAFSSVCWNWAEPRRSVVTRYAYDEVASPAIWCFEREGQQPPAIRNHLFRFRCYVGCDCFVCFLNYRLCETVLASFVACLRIMLCSWVEFTFLLPEWWITVITNTVWIKLCWISIEAVWMWNEVSVF